MERIFLDNNATTLLDPRVIEVMSKALSDCWGNPSSIHYYGQEAKKALATARRTAAACLGVTSNELIFCSGGTEALNIAIRGLLGNGGSGHVISSSVEHAAVLKTLEATSRAGWEVSFLDPGFYGAVTASAVEAALRPDTKLIVLMAANNETGVKTDIAAIAAIAEQRGLPFIVDGTAILGKEQLVIPKGVAAMAFSGHKLHGPKGTGLLVLKRNHKLASLLYGGGQEGGRRPGTENVPGILGFTEALRLAVEALPHAAEHIAQLRDKFEQALIESIGDVVINGEGPRVCNTSNLAFIGVDGESLLMSLDLEGVAASHGSACHSGALEPSRVLLNMGISRERATQSLRFSLSRMTTERDVDVAVEVITRVVKRLRSYRRTLQPV